MLVSGGAIPLAEVVLNKWRRNPLTSPWPVRIVSLPAHIVLGTMFLSEVNLQFLAY